MENDLSYLEGMETGDKHVLKNLSQMGEKLKELSVAMNAAQAAADTAKKAYEHYANVVIPQEMFSAGVDSIGLTSGGKLSIKRNFYCQPNKNDEDKQRIATWLRENGGAHLIKSDVSVSAESINKLSDLGIAYTESTAVNTTSLKSFIKDKLGVTTGVQQLSIEQIPDCIHFQEVVTVALEV